jgi:hypothetical protein
MELLATEIAQQRGDTEIFSSDKEENQLADGQEADNTMPICRPNSQQMDDDVNNSRSSIDSQGNPLEINTDELDKLRLLINNISNTKNIDLDSDVTETLDAIQNFYMKAIRNLKNKTQNIVNANVH